MYPLSFFRLRNLRYAFCFLICFHEIHCNSVHKLRSPHAPVTASFPFSFTIRCSHAPGKISKLHTRQFTDGHTDRQTLTSHAGIVGFAIMVLLHHANHIIPEVYVTFPLPYPSSPASGKLLLTLSVQDSHNISLNDRYHHSLSSLYNNKTVIYLSICLFIYL